jgi:hypothetical protein
MSETCSYCHSVVASRDPFHVHGCNECHCGEQPAHNQYLHDDARDAARKSLAELRAYLAAIAKAERRQP